MLLKNTIRQGPSRPVSIFASYAREDRQYLDRLRVHLTLLIREGIAELWTEQQIASGDNWHEEIQENVRSAHIIVFLVSADFLASDYIWYQEMDVALTRHRGGQAVVVPILVRDVEWETAPFAFIEMLPKGCLPISAWKDPELAFTEVTRAIRDLIRTIDQPVTLDLGWQDTKGATIQIASDQNSGVPDFCRSDLLLFPSEPFNPPTMKAMLVPKRGTARRQHFIFNWGDQSEGKRDESERQRLFRYFRASLTVPDEDQWVNLSAYESNRMIPRKLVGTLLGHDLLQFDCDLKRLSATMMHPGFETGAAYWRVLQQRLSAEGLGCLSIHAFQKVTLLPTHALIYTPANEKDAKEVLGKLLNIPDAGECAIAYVLEHELSLLCSADNDALKHNMANMAVTDQSDVEVITKANAIVVDTFKELVIPVMEREIRFGSSFARVRQMYSAMLLAAWAKRQHAEGTIDLPSVDCGSIEGLNLGTIQGPDSVPDTRDFYAEYLQLFKDGIFRTTRRQFDPVTGGCVTRRYFSGAFKSHSRITTVA